MGDGRYPSGEGSVVQDFRAMDQETNHVDPFIFEIVAKMSLPIM